MLDQFLIENDNSRMKFEMQNQYMETERFAKRNALRRVDLDV